MIPEISVVVCTYNRSDMLQDVLTSLVRQTLDKTRYEIIVVDNNSTDDTRAVVEKYLGEGNFSYYFEPLQGLGHARNCGWKNARGTYIAYIDDDARATTEWLEKALECFADVSPKPVAVGGQIVPFYIGEKPSWFKDVYELRSWGDQPLFLTRGEALSGSNMVLRRDLHEKYGGFDESVGVTGNYLSVGEETGLFLRIWREQPDAVIHYSPEIIVRHSVPLFKMRVSYILKRAFVVGQVWWIQHGPTTLGGRLRMLLGVGWSLIKKVVTTLVSVAGHRVVQHWLIESVTPVAFEAGRLFRCMGLTWRIKQRS